MASPHSGLHKKVVLVRIETKAFSLMIKGIPFHKQYESLHKYKNLDFHEAMNFSVEGKDIEKVEVFDVNEGKLVESLHVRPIFFENNTYDLLAIPKNEESLSFHHEHPMLKRSVTFEQIGEQWVLTGDLSFQNEVGFTSFDIYADDELVLSVRMEVFPVKMDYKTDYMAMVEEVNEIIYNLAYHFIRKTFVKARTKIDGEPSRVEFFRLITVHFQHFLDAIHRIEKQPHHQLEKIYEKARGDQLAKQDAFTRNYLRKRNHLFVKVARGIPIENNQYMPMEGLRIRKHLSFDTLENRYIKWMIERLIFKLIDLEEKIVENLWFEEEVKDQQSDIRRDIRCMRGKLESKLKNSFWQNIGTLDRTMISLVLQMAPGYREAFQIYLTVTKGLALQGSFYRMSLKDIASLYEYWTFIKLGKILAKKYDPIHQDVLQIRQNGLYVNLDARKSARQVFKHPVTDERITLTYQYHPGSMPTTNQIPDTTLHIEKKGKDFTYNYIFDAKYRIDFARKGSTYQQKYRYPGPMEEDINTMHRYRDAIVSTSGNTYERESFGAYVLFPWVEDDIYKEHHFYKSIDEVNIGGLPFLPGNSELVEQFIERLIDMSPEEIHEKGILPKGTEEEWRSGFEEKVLVGLVSTADQYHEFIKNSYYIIPLERLKNDWRESKYVALYVKQGIGITNGISIYGKIEDIEINNYHLKLSIDYWRDLSQIIRPVNYGIANYMITTLDTLKEAQELPELFMKSKREMTLWRMLRRVSDQIKVDLDEQNIDEASKIKHYSIRSVTISVLHEEDEFIMRAGREERRIPLIELDKNPSKVFKNLTQLLVDSS